MKIFFNLSTFFFLIFSAALVFFPLSYSQSLSGSSLKLLRSSSNELILPPDIDPPLETAGNVFFNPYLTTGLNNGTTWDNAYQTWGAFNWTNVDAGDTIFIHGVPNDTTWLTTTIGFGKSGTSGNKIVIMPGYSLGHNGVVISKVGRTSGLYGFRSDAATWTTRNYWKLYGIGFQDGDTTSTKPQVVILAGIGWEIENCKTNMISGRGFINIDGNGNSGTENCGDWIIKNCSTYAVSKMREYSNNQEDFIYSSYCNTGTNIIEGNYAYLWNKIYVHQDAVQLVYEACNYIIRNNHFNGGTQQTDGINLSTPNATGKKWQVYNNLLEVTTNKNGAGIDFYASATGAIDSLMIYNNTIYMPSADGFKGIILAYDSPSVNGKVYVKNNIIYRPNADATPPISIYGTLTNYANWQNNLIYQPTDAVMYISGSSPTYKTWAQWQAMSGNPDINGINANPLFTTDGSNFTLQAGSPAVNAGITLGVPYNVDILGVARPHVSGYSVGAFEK